MQKKRVLFIQQQGLVVSGLGTLLSRLSQHLLSQGDEVDVLFTTTVASGAVVRLLPAGARVLFIDPWEDRFFPFTCRRLFASRIGEYDKIISFSPMAFFVGMILRDYLKLGSECLLYVVNFEAFSSAKCCGLMWLTRKAIIKETSSSFVFMNEDCRRNWMRTLGKDFGLSRIVPLPVQPRRCVEYRRRKPWRIVSIGRIDNRMKAYNWSLIGPLKRLRQEGLNFTWHIYGGGSVDDVESLRGAIRAAGCSDFIVFHGELLYEKFEQVLVDTDVFVGMGTGAAEAASAGVPTIVATAYSKEPKSHGFFHELPFGNLGEEIPGRRSMSIAGLVTRVLKMPAPEYYELRKRSAEAARRYDIKSAAAELLERNRGTALEEKVGKRSSGSWVGMALPLLKMWRKCLRFGAKVLP